MTNIGALWTLVVWGEAIRERKATFPALFQSKAVSRNPLFDKLASGSGIGTTVPLLRDITDTSDEVQKESTAPVANNGIGGALQYFPIMNRVTKFSATALSKQLSGADPLGEVLNQINDTRLKQRQKTFISLLRGLFASAGAAGLAGALTDCRYVNGAGNEIFIEDGAAATDANLFNPDVFIGTKGLMGELGDSLRDGVLLMHSTVKSRLEVLDSLNFKKTVLASELPFTIDSYRDIPVIVSDSLCRAGTATGKVFDTYLLASSTVGYGEKAQAGDVADVASLQYFHDKEANDEFIYDRTRHMQGIAGTRYKGAPADPNNGPTNAELQDRTAWELAFSSAKLCGAVCVRTNG